jgi:hypothetical protein
VVEPSTVYLKNWHIDLIAEYLEAVTAEPGLGRLLINTPQNRPAYRLCGRRGFWRAVRFRVLTTRHLRGQDGNGYSPGRQIRYNAETRPHGHFLRDTVVIRATAPCPAVSARPWGHSGETQKRSWKTLKPSDILVSILGLEDAPAGVSTRRCSAQRRTTVREIAKLVNAGKVRAIVEMVLPLAEARRAQELNEAGDTRGKIVLWVI